MTAKVLDLLPRLRRKAASECRHDTVSIGMHTAEATCDGCGAEIDPWSLLRATVDHQEEVAAAWEAQVLAWDADQKRMDASFAEAMSKGQAALDDMNRQIARKHEELRELTERKNRLMNTQINGKSLMNYRKVPTPRKPGGSAP